MPSAKLWLYFVIFVALNILLYTYIVFFNHSVRFSAFDYTYNANHYLTDAQIHGGKFDFLRALGQYDAQWYLRIAQEGYPKNPHSTTLNDKNILDGATYAFFPLYSLGVAIMNLLLRNVELSAFIFSNILLVANFFSLYFFIKRFFNETIAFKTIFLLFFFPFSIFYRSYFTEGLFLLLLIWFAYFLMRKRWMLSASFLALLAVTRPNGIVFSSLYFFSLIRAYCQKRVTMRTILDSLIIILTPFTIWLIYCYYQTGDAFYWVSIQSAWFGSNLPLFQNLITITHFFTLAWHSFHSSKVDALTILTVGALLFIGRKKMKPELWWISMLLWITPLLTKDTMSFTRYQIVSFPLFMYLAERFRTSLYISLLCIFCSGLFVLSLFFVNWYWIG